MMIFSLKDFRESKLGQSRKAVAEKLNVTEKTLAKWENEEVLPGTNGIKAILREYGLSIENVRVVFRDNGTGYLQLVI